MRRCGNVQELISALDFYINRRTKTGKVLVEDFKEIHQEYALLGFSNGKEVCIPGILKLLTVSEQNKGIARQGMVMPVGDLKALHSLEDNGFRFMETQLSFQYDLSKYRTPPELEKLLYPISIREVPHEISKWKEVSDRISPDLFETDRIALDPLFGPQIGCMRYRNWILDLEKMTDSHLLLFCDPSDENIEYGFTIDRLDEKTKTLHGILGGVFTDCDKPGIGFSIYDASFRNDIKRGAKILKSAISSNNPPVMAVDSALGISIRKLTYVWRKQFN